jgi:hypothetical protein
MDGKRFRWQEKEGTMINGTGLAKFGFFVLLAMIALGAVGMFAYKQNEELAELQQRFSECSQGRARVEEQLRLAQAQVDDLQTVLAQKEAENAGLRGQVGVLEQQIEVHRRQIAELQEEKSTARACAEAVIPVTGQNSPAADSSADLWQGVKETTSNPLFWGVSLGLVSLAGGWVPLHLLGEQRRKRQVRK